LQSLELIARYKPVMHIAQSLCAQGRSVLFYVHLKAEDKILSWTFKCRLQKTERSYL